MTRTGEQRVFQPRIISQVVPATSYHDGMTTVPRVGRGKALRPYRVEVTRRHRGEAPFGWQIFRRDKPQPIARSERGFASETAAWNAGASAMHALEQRKT